jgi:hypothetical protein
MWQKEVDLLWSVISGQSSLVSRLWSVVIGHPQENTCGLSPGAIYVTSSARSSPFTEFLLLLVIAKVRRKKVHKKKIKYSATWLIIQIEYPFHRVSITVTVTMIR